MLRALERGETSERRATIIARETAHLPTEHRARIDEAITHQLSGWGDGRTEREVRAWVQRLDPHGAADRAAKMRDVPGSCTGASDPDEHRGRGQIMADTLVDRVLTPAEGEPVVPGVEPHLVMTDRTLADADVEPAQVVGYGSVPVPLARDLVRADDQTRVWVRRLYTDPATGDLAGTDARERDFPRVAWMFLTCRDQVCRTPFCAAPIRHADHSLAVSSGGMTDLHNGAGRCDRCKHGGHSNCARSGGEP